MTPFDVAADPIAQSVRKTGIGRYVTDRCESVGGCWIWTGAHNGHGYPQINRPATFGKGMAHALLFRAVRRDFGRPIRLTNTCGNRSCCHPDHWRLMTPGAIIAKQYRNGLRGPREILYRAALKGHANRAVRTGSLAKAAEARAMRDGGATVVAIAAHFGVSTATAGRWSRGASWRPVTPFSGLAG